MTDLTEHIKAVMGFDSTNEDGVLYRRRHIEALNKANSFLDGGNEQLNGHGAGKLLAEDL